MKTLIAIETAAMACSVALITPQQCYSRFMLTQKEHTQHLLPMINDLLHEANLGLTDIQAVAVGRGPGSFTGVRIAISAAQGLAYGLNIPVFPVSTLEALCAKGISESTLPEAVVIPALDARMQEIYAGAYNLQENGSYSTLLSELLIAPHQLSIPIGDKPIIALGSGWDVYEKELMALFSANTIYLLKERQPEALQVGLIAQKQIQQGMQGINAKMVRPVYLRDTVAVKPTKNLA